MKTYKKALGPRTIIPDGLYVDRDADRQLDAVIEEMGRPAYVLVARQMGKTNLLLRMKRTREKLGELAVYVDLSIGFDDARALFRYLIDNLLAVNDLPEVERQIKQERIAAEFDPSVEYDRHLRRVLNSTEHDRVIIILDEIDSLVGQAYSDRILSQIRSMYFARANFSVYERLTYVLSGVAEPTDLIKDKNISPFNIGEKIYLNDFSRSEADLLLKKAGVELPLDVREAVYDWTSGNPRMTWDVYSSLEDAIAASEQVTIATVEATISKLYLTRFDRAPLDHIRALAENDLEVRTALIALLYGKGDTLDDRSRSKLYLAGITTASANDAPRIKNRVIEQSLSEAWLAQVEAGRTGLLSAADRRYSERAYAEAIDLFEQFLNSGSSLESFDEIQLLQYGMALYHHGKYEVAITILEKARKQARSAEVRAMLSYHVGLSNMLSGDTKAAIDLFNKLAESPGTYRLRALHATGSVYLTISAVDNADTIVNINERVLEEVDSEPDFRATDKAEVVSAAHFNLGQVYLAQGDRPRARLAFEAAHEAAEVPNRPSLAYLRLLAADDDSEKLKILRQASEVLTTHDVKYSESSALVGFKKRDMAALIATAIYLKQADIFENLVSNAMTRASRGRYDVLYELAVSSDRKADIRYSQEIFGYIARESSDLTDALLQQRLRAAAIYLSRVSEIDHDEAFKSYWKLVTVPEALEYLSANDLVAMANQVGRLLNRGVIADAKPIVSFVRKHEERLIASSNLMFAFFVYQELVVHRMEGNYERTISAAQEVLRLVSPERLEGDVDAMAHSAMVDQLRASAAAYLANHRPIKPSFGRNQFVYVRSLSGGNVSYVKFKKVADRIASGELEIVESSSLPSAIDKVLKL